MGRRLWRAALLGLLVAQGAGADAPLVLSDRSYGLVRFGERLADIEGRLRERAVPEEGDPSCDFVAFGTYPGIRFMVESGIVTRGDVVDPAIPNALGVSLGMPLAQVRRLHPGALVRRHAYDPEGHYVVVASPDGDRAVVLEEARGKIVHIRAGLEPSVEYMEGCR